MKDPIRCPFCVLGNEFRPMVCHVDGTFLCNRCGHTTRPKDENYSCGCYKCAELQRVSA